MKDLTLADHAELWARENGLDVPERETAQWAKMYERYIEWAFADFAELEDAE